MNKEGLEEWEELENEELGLDDWEKLEDDDVEIEIPDSYSESESDSDAKRALVGAAARILFYPTLMYNVARNKIEPEFHWWDEIDPVTYLHFTIFIHPPYFCYFKFQLLF
ncbi:hypothetical protein BVC80_8555g12 [Macleaya cordata]|uniref:Uncharacterized protein n=1 Tax=Macleaya cordata TaxID=56857 RepID=A0A200QVC3_MACCD|nr:hypothetical protein BVC80_8555g12 [Macleaya cordata]